MRYVVWLLTGAGIGCLISAIWTAEYRWQFVLTAVVALAAAVTIDAVVSTARELGGGDDDDDRD